MSTSEILQPHPIRCRIYLLLANRIQLWYNNLHNLSKIAILPKYKLALSDQTKVDNTLEILKRRKQVVIVQR